MAYWLLKSEPSTWSWENQQAVEREPWNGVRNAQATSYLKQMKVQDLCFFYHSILEKKIVGIVKVVRTFYPDSTDSSGRFGMVDVQAVASLKNPVSLGDIKSHSHLRDLPFVRQSRLSVSPVDPLSWETLLKLGGLSARHFS
jgi:predicted RNA-binding protein with PUA-like domain